MEDKAFSGLTVLCEQQVLDGILESHFIRDVLLGGITRPVRIVPLSDPQSAAPSDDVLIINLFDRMVKLIRKFIDAGSKNIGVLHMGDEKCVCDRSFYGDVDYVIRNYFFKDAFLFPNDRRCLNVMWVPNGYRTGVGPRQPATLLPIGVRTNTLFFAGFVGAGGGIPERVEMLDIIKQHQLPAVVVKTPGFAKGLGPASYSALLENSCFALVPRGQAAETVRLFDALELGCIPISLEHPFLQVPEAMLGAPVVQLKSWQDLPNWIARTMASPTYESDVGDLQKKCLGWWSDFKQIQQNRVASLIEHAFSR